MLLNWSTFETDLIYGLSVLTDILRVLVVVSISVLMGNVQVIVVVVGISFVLAVVANSQYKSGTFCGFSSATKLIIIREFCNYIVSW